MKPSYDLNKIKFATDSGTFERAVGLYEKGKVTEFTEDAFGFGAVVIGTEPYQVTVSARHYDHATCDCYLGENNTLCKHAVALAIRAVAGGTPLTAEDKKQVSEPVCSERIGSLTTAEVSDVKKEMTAAMRYIKPYNGPSRLWFQYQDSLSEGCARLSAIVSDLPASEKTAQLLIDVLLRLDKKLSTGGVDDSDGTVGGFIDGVEDVLVKYARLDPACIRAFQKLKGKETCFGWEEPLVALSSKLI